MRDSTKEILYMLLWMTEHVCRPRMQHVGESYETWAWRNGYLHDLERLQARRLLRGTGQGHRMRNLAVTATGRGALHGRRDPEAEWQRPWDGIWRLVTFDVQATDESGRKALRRFLTRHHFGCFQRSVWITPDPVEPLLGELRRFGTDPCRLVVLEAKCLDGHPATRIAQSSWRFDLVQAAYERYRTVLETCSPLGFGDGPCNPSARAWLQRERLAWLEAVEMDPLLPYALVPENYLGRAMWEARRGTLEGLTSWWLDGDRAGATPSAATTATGESPRVF